MLLDIIEEFIFVEIVIGRKEKEVFVVLVMIWGICLFVLFLDFILELIRLGYLVMKIY